MLIDINKSVKTIHAVLIIIFLIYLTDCVTHRDEKIHVVASILPHKYFIERIGGEYVDVEVMVKPGMNPATFEPLPGQLLKLDDADIYIQSGVPFEKVWLPRIQANHTRLKYINTLNGIDLHEIESIDDTVIQTAPQETHNDESTIHDTHKHDHNGLDPHVWLSPQLVKIQTQTICNALCDEDPEHADLYRNNLLNLHHDLDDLSHEISNTFSKLDEKSFLVFHPAWGYFAQEFGLTQYAIEAEGKEPGPKELMQIIEFARKHDIRVIFVQSQFNSDVAHAVAKQIDAVIVTIDPLAENYIENLRHVSQDIAVHLNRSSKP